MKRILLACAAVLALAAPARADCPDMATVARFARALLERGVPQPFILATPADTRCAQDRLVAMLAQPWGDVEGVVLAAETLPPLRGALLHAALRESSGATLEARFGARPAVAPGVLLRVNGEGRAVAVSPYLALLDLAALAGGTDASARIAGNLGLRLGVVGPEAPLPDAVPDGLLQVDGGTVAALPRLGLAAAPQALVAPLARDLLAEGRPLRGGELVALLAAPAPMAPRPGETWRLSIEGVGAVVLNFR